MIDTEKRKRVMQRSMRLGHCICDPKKACPCDLFKAKNVCLCAGETLEAPTGPVRLTSLVQKAGCASKIDQASLKRILGELPETDDPKVLVGSAAGDDAGVYALDDRLCLVQTVDVFCPSVDDPYVFGQIAAANSLSDVYAMGGRPLTALSIIGFPVREVPDALMRDMLRGGIDKMAEAGVPVVGGHSIRDPEIKAGFAVTGVVDRDRIFTNAGARPGDALVLTKPLGTGILAFAVQIGRAPDGAAEAIAASMAALNRTASQTMAAFDAHACTDVTGFGLMGHLAEMARASAVDVEVTWDDVPLLAGVLECLAEGIIPGGIERNRESSAASAHADDGVSEAMLDLCFDPQTSGGLLIALPAAKAEAFVARLHAGGVTAATVIGSVQGEGTGRVAVTTTGRRTMPAPAEPQTTGKGIAMSIEPDQPCCAGGEPVPAAARDADEPCCAGPQASDAACCADGAAPAGGTAATPQAFMAFMKQAMAPGALDAATKQAITVALSVFAKCEPCLKIHIQKARQMGFSQAEIDEAAWMAIAFGGGPTMMFYKEAVRKMAAE